MAISPASSVPATSNMDAGATAEVSDELLKSMAVKLGVGVLLPIAKQQLTEAINKLEE